MTLCDKAGGIPYHKNQIKFAVSMAAIINFEYVLSELKRKGLFGNMLSVKSQISTRFQSQLSRAFNVQPYVTT